MKNIFKTTDAELGLYLYFVVEAFLPAVVFFYACGSILGDLYYTKVQPQLWYLRTILGAAPQPIKYQTQ